MPDPFSPIVLEMDYMDYSVLKPNILCELLFD